VLWLALLVAAPVSAHDLERTQVTLTFARDGSFVLDVANDPSWLLLRLEPFHSSFADRVVLWVDGHEVRPSSVEYIPSPTLGTFRLRGLMPLDAHTLRWYYGLVIDPYPLTIRRADGRVLVEEIAGDAWSRTIDLSGQFHAPLLTERSIGIVLAGLLIMPVVFRMTAALQRRRRIDTKVLYAESVLGRPGS
jgi:hypothetical protein